MECFSSSSTSNPVATTNAKKETASSNSGTNATSALQEQLLLLPPNTAFVTHSANVKSPFPASTSPTQTNSSAPSNLSLASFGPASYEASVLLSHPEVVEVISRPAEAGRPWVAARRLEEDASFTRDADGDLWEKVRKEAHLILAKDGASVVDVDREMGALCGRFC
jgi:hypothetical protein